MSLSLLISSINMIVKGYFGVTLRLCLTKMVHRESDLGPNLLIGSESVLWFCCVKHQNIPTRNLGLYPKIRSHFASAKTLSLDTYRSVVRRTFLLVGKLIYALIVYSKFFFSQYRL